MWSCGASPAARSKNPTGATAKEREKEEEREEISRQSSRLGSRRTKRGGFVPSFVSLSGTDFRFNDSHRIEAAALLAPGGSSKYLLHAIDGNDPSGLSCTFLHRADLLFENVLADYL